MKRCEAPSCDVDFEPQRSTARYCTATCRSRAARARKAAEDNAAAEAKTGTDAEHTLVKAVRDQLEAADALGTVAGQLALQIARRIADPACTGVSTLSKELRALLAEATGSKPTGEEEETDPTPDTEAGDELDEIRRRREEARQAAGLA